MKQKQKTARLLNNRFVLNLLCLSVISTFLILGLNPGGDNIKIYIVSIFFVILFTAPLYWMTDSYLVPKFLLMGRYWRFGIISFFAIIITAYISLVFTRYLIYFIFISEDSGFHRPEVISDESFGPFLYYYFLFIWNAILGMLASGAIRIYYNAKDIEREIALVSNQKLSSELKLIKNLINPDLMMSMISTIKVSIEPDNKEAIKVTDTFINMLNYQLYECNHPEIDIQKEIKYISSFIEVQKYRLEKDTTLEYNVSEDIPDIKIVPFIFLPLVENTFKHVSHFAEPEKNKIHIDIEIQKNRVLKITTCNTFNPLSKSASHIEKKSGVGIDNLKKRLELSYPHRYQIDSYSKGAQYFNSLILQL